MGKPGQNAPSEQQMNAFKAADWDGPVWMINLLKFRPQASYADPAEPLRSGRDAYMHYGGLSAPFLRAVGGRPVSMLEPRNIVIGDESDAWDMVMVVEYPSRDAFLTMVTDPGYLAVTKHRSAALERSALIASRKLDGLAAPAGTR